MVLYIHENKAVKLFKKCKADATVTVLSTDRSMVACDFGGKKGSVNYVYPENLYPSVDDLQGYMRGDISAKSIIKKMVRALTKPKKEATPLQLEASVMVNLLNSPQNRGNILVFIRPNGDDQESRKLDKFFKKYIEALFDIFGVEVMTKLKKSYLKGSKSEVTKRLRQLALTKGKLSKIGRYRLNVLHACRYVDIQCKTLDEYTFSEGELEINKRTRSKFADRFARLLIPRQYVEMFDGAIERWPSKKDMKSIHKMLVKQAKESAELYNEYRNFVVGTGIDRVPNLPKLTKKIRKKGMTKKQAVKFIKFYTKRKNFGYMIGALNHISASVNNIEIGSTAYTDMMVHAHRSIQVPEFSKAYVSACVAYRKAVKQELAARAKAAAVVSK